MNYIACWITVVFLNFPLNRLCVILIDMLSVGYIVPVRLQWSCVYFAWGHQYVIVYVYDIGLLRKSVFAEFECMHTLLAYCPACRTSLIATRFRAVVICPIIKCLTVLEFSFIFFYLCLFITIFNFILNYVPDVTFWIFTYHKIWILIFFCFIWNYWIIYFLTCLEVFWSVVS